MDFEQIKSHFTVKQNSKDSCKAICPVHKDKEASLSISYDSQGNKTLVYCHAGCDTRAVLDAVGLKVTDLFDKDTIIGSRHSTKEIAAIYQYKDGLGNLLFEKVRFHPKSFSQRRIIDGATVWGLEAGVYCETYAGSNNWSMKEREGVGTKEFPGISPVLYRLPELIQAVKNKQTVFIVEGEKDVDNLIKLGYTATCNFDGASKSKSKPKWRPEYNQYFKDADIILIPDNDNPGRSHMDSIIKNISCIVNSIKLVELPVAEKGDVSDWLAMGHIKEELENIMGNTKVIHRQAAKAEEIEQKREISLINYHFSDVGNAERLVALYGMDIRFSHIRQNFYIWDGSHWKIDNADMIFKLAKATIRRLEADGEDISTGNNEKDEERKKQIKAFVLRSESDQKIKAMVNQLKSQPEVIMQDIDTDPFILNFKNGTLDLKTGESKEHNRFDYITKKIDVEYNPTSKCPNWVKFLDIVFDGDKELIRYVQKSIGYSLTGAIDEQCFYMLTGNGANGKSTFLNAIMNIMSDYTEVLKGSSLMTRHNDGGARGDLAKLQGKRFVWASELNEGQTFDESLIKSLTGGDPISVRFLYGEEFNLKTQFKLWIATNEKPKIKGTNYGIWRRVRLIPFNHKFKDSEKDPKFYEHCLEPELSGILNWAVEGCLAWLKDGIQTPGKVLAATEEYKDEMDTLQMFIDDCCITGNKYTSKINDIYDTYLTWCEESREHELSNIKFTKKLKEKGFEQIRNTYSRCWVGIGIVAQQNKKKGYIHQIGM